MPIICSLAHKEQSKKERKRGERREVANALKGRRQRETDVK